jgi:hypothetical protein
LIFKIFSANIISPGISASKDKFVTVLFIQYYETSDSLVNDALDFCRVDCAGSTFEALEVDWIFNI